LTIISAGGNQKLSLSKDFPIVEMPCTWKIVLPGEEEKSNRREGNEPSFGRAGFARTPPSPTTERRQEEGTLMLRQAYK